MKRTSILLVAALLLACGTESHFITDAAYRKQVHEDYLKTRELAEGRSVQLFSVMSEGSLTAAEKEAMEFLYAYMPLGDLADYDGEFFLDQVRGAFRACDEFKWGKTVPEDIFRHFVLVHRVNNEYLDTCRNVFYNELRDRVKGLNMYDAALEVNHWCHEKVTYRATDGRTSAPLALMLTSWGRCGEETTFTVAALRAVGIPARQCYTPRWVHTDSNHAWVEVWVDGKWYFMGACEPEAVLNEAWFTVPATRAMMVHTNVFGKYNGPEQKNRTADWYSLINVLDTYAPVKTLSVTVWDNNGKPVEGASVDFLVYNYAEFYPVHSDITGPDGTIGINTGYGDILVWAVKDSAYGYVKADAREEKVDIILDRAPGESYTERFVMEVPQPGQVERTDAALDEINCTHLAREDSIRGAYMATFAGAETAAELAASTGLAAAELEYFLTTAQGNWREIYHFIEENTDNEALFPFLGTLFDKDLRDTPADFLNDHLNGQTIRDDDISEDIMVRKILSPRVGLELITPWRGYFLTEGVLPEEELKTGADILEYVSRRIKILDERAYYNCLITPRGVHELGVADSRSRDVYFVAICRSLDIPAELAGATGKPRYYERGIWIEADFIKTEAVVNPQGRVRLENSTSNIFTPSYGTNYSLARLEDGLFRTLGYRGSLDGSDLPTTIDADAGYYRLLKASRANDGSVAIEAEYFTLEENQSRNLIINLPRNEGKLTVHGIMDLNTVVITDSGEKTDLKAISNDKGLLLVFADPDREPTKHVFQDLPKRRVELEEWGGGIIFMVPDDKKSSSFDAGMFEGLPEGIVWATDTGRALLSEAVSTLKVDFSNNFPLTIYVSSSGGILYYSAGFTIGTADDVVHIIERERESFK